MFSSFKKSFESFKTSITKPAAAEQSPYDADLPSEPEKPKQETPSTPSPSSSSSSSSSTNVFFQKIKKAFEIPAPAATQPAPSNEEAKTGTAAPQKTSSPFDFLLSKTTPPSSSSSSSSSSSGGVPLQKTTPAPAPILGSVPWSGSSSSLATAADDDFAPAHLWRTNVNRDAGSALVKAFEAYWEAIRINNINNAREAEMADRQLQSVISAANKQFVAIKDLEKQFQQLPSLVSRLQQIQTDIDEINSRIERLEPVYLAHCEHEVASEFFKWKQSVTHTSFDYEVEKKKELAIVEKQLEAERSRVLKDTKIREQMRQQQEQKKALERERQIIQQQKQQQDLLQQQFEAQMISFRKKTPSSSSVGLSSSSSSSSSGQSPSSPSTVIEEELSSSEQEQLQSFLGDQEKKESAEKVPVDEESSPESEPEDENKKGLVTVEEEEPKAEYVDLASQLSSLQEPEEPVADLAAPEPKEESVSEEKEEEKSEVAEQNDDQPQQQEAASAEETEEAVEGDE